ncbi:MAG: hypothetical protein JXM73_21570 [Anaerolineae bacterium]|nr:hypothetical protein [Anaerolineae bacterium]
MEATEVFNKLQPSVLIVDDGMGSNARKYIDGVEEIERRGTWDQLDDLAAACQDLRGIDPNYPVLAIRLANAYLQQAGNLNTARNQLTRALEILDCQTGPVCHQNRAVTLLYLGLTLHFMKWHNDALHLYQEAHNQFRNAALDWQRSSPGHARAIQCEIAADRLQECAKEVLKNIAPSKASVPTPSAWKPKNIPQTPTPPRPQSHKPPALLSTTAIIALGVLVCLLIIAIMLITYYLGGRVALLITAAVLVSMAAVAIVTGLSYTQGGLFLQVPQDYEAVIEQNGALFVVQPGQAQVLIPWFCRLHALVPMKELQHKLPKQKVSLGKSASGTNTHVYLIIQVDYRVLSAVDATSPTGGLSTASRDHKGVWREEELKTKWQDRLQIDLAPLLANHMWGATEADCYTFRDRLQTSLRNDVTKKTRLWGIEVENLTILDIGTA